MNLFQKYETEVKPFTVGKRFICVAPESANISPDALGEIMEVIKRNTRTTMSGSYMIRYRILTGEYKGTIFSTPSSSIKLAYKPYDGEIPDESEKMENVTND